jgi:hypothetical protein
MPASRVQKSAFKKRKDFSKEVAFKEKRARNGGVVFKAVDVLDFSTTPSSPSPSISRQSTEPPQGHTMDVDPADMSSHFSQNVGPSKKSKTSKKVSSVLLGLLSKLNDTVQIPDQPLKSWLELRDQYLSILLQQEALSHTICHICKLQDKLYRCGDCFGSLPCCQSCLLQTHITSPFHRIQHWNGQFFQAAQLVNLGYILHSGHSGLQCPHSTPENDILICIVDVIGVFHHKLRWCACQSAEPFYAQLLRLGLYPSSMERPETAFTFSLLDYFHIDAVECKTSANNFYNKLRRLTNSLFPHKVPVSVIFILIVSYLNQFNSGSVS